MRLSLAVKAVLAAWQSNEVPLLVGEPGLGKSESIFAAARQVNRKVHVTKNLGMDEPTELKGYGMPDFKEGVTKILPMKWVKELNEQEPGVVFYDELGQALQSTMCASAPTFLPDPQGRRRVGEVFIKPDHYFAAATNRREDRSCVNALPDFFASRLVELPVEFSFTDWEKWAVVHEIHPYVLAFGRLTSDKIHQYVPGKRCPLARSWTKVSEFEKASADDETKRVLIEGTIGKETTLIYWELRNCVDKLPRMEDILAGKRAKVPDNKGMQYLVVCILGNKTTKQNVGNILDYIENFGGEFQQLFMSDIRARDSSLIDVRAVQQYLERNGGLKV